MMLADLSLIKPMLIRSLSNPEAIKLFINNIILGKILATTIGIVIFILVIHYIYSLIYCLIKNRKNEKENEKENEKQDCNSSYFKKLLLDKVKNNLCNYRYFFLGLLLLALSWSFINLFFRLVDTGGVSCKFSPEENYLLGLRAIYSLSIFIIASMFIMFCFGNKFVRNTGIFTFIICILFILMGKFISLGCIGM